MQVVRAGRGWRGAAGWILATGLGAPLAAAAGCAAGWALRPHIGLAPGTSAGWAVAGLCLGLAQWLVLRAAFVPGARVWWALALAGGAAVGHAAASALAALVFGILARSGQIGAAEAPSLRATVDAHALLSAAVLAGLVAGVVQWRLIRSAAPDAGGAGWWVPGLTVGLALAQEIALTVQYRVAFALQDPSYMPVRTGVTTIAAWAVAGPMLGLVTGPMLGYAVGRTEKAITERRRPGLRFALLWLVMSMIASTIGMSLQGIAAGLGIFATSLIGGAAQWLLLRSHVPRASLWIVASVAGAVIGMVVAGYVAVGVYLASGLSALVADSAGWVIHMLTVTAAIGLAQWLVLRQAVERAGWWVLAGLFAEVLTLAVLPFVVLLTRLVAPADQSAAGRALLGLVLAAPLAGLVHGVVSTTAMTLILRRGGPSVRPGAVGPAAELR